MSRVQIHFRSSSQQHCKAEAENSRRCISETFSPAMAYHCSNFTCLLVYRSKNLVNW